MCIDARAIEGVLFPVLSVDYPDPGVIRARLDLLGTVSPTSLIYIW